MLPDDLEETKCTHTLVYTWRGVDLYSKWITDAGYSVIYAANPLPRCSTLQQPRIMMGVAEIS